MSFLNGIKTILFIAFGGLLLYVFFKIKGINPVRYDYTGSDQVQTTFEKYFPNVAEFWELLKK